jgi:flagellar biosynthesis/type III secretory pathway chaperone
MLTSEQRRHPQEQASQDGLRVILEKLTTVLTAENQQIESGVQADHASFIATKNQILKELMFLHRSIDARDLTAHVQDELARVRKLVDRNHHLLGLQVQALNDVTQYFTKAAIARDGDGTYSRDVQ